MGSTFTEAAELGAQSVQLHTHFLTNWQLKPAFSRKKNFENLLKIDQVSGKNVNFLAASTGPGYKMYQSKALDRLVGRI